MHKFTAVAAVAAISTGAFADSVVIDGLGGPVNMESLPLSILGNAPHDFTDGDMATVHTSLHGSGIVTDGFITCVLLNTDAGLTFAAMIDDAFASNASQIGGSSSIFMATTAPSSAEWYVNDVADFDAAFDPQNITETVAASYEWSHDEGADAYAWTNLEAGDSVSYNWTLDSAPGLASTPFQFVTWNGESWEVLATGNWTDDDQFAFSFTVVPLPAALGLGMLGLGGVAALRRRMSSK